MTLPFGPKGTVYSMCSLASSLDPVTFRSPEFLNLVKSM